jgi:N-acetylglucosaminyl-diphospho-decaprenol L-rhamnosyltransferase
MTAQEHSLHRAPADVVTVVVVHDSAKLLSPCLQAVLRAATRLDARVLVADSGSSDEPQEVCFRLGVPFAHGPNRGLGAAFNRALEHQEVRGARYVLQVNPDVLLPPGGLDELVGLADRQPGCGILAPRQVDQLGRLICSVGLEPTPTAYWRAARELWGDWNWRREDYAQEREADWVMGACMLLRRDMLEAIGGFDERFFLCSEEVDLCRRARAAGWSVRYTPAVTVVHPLAGRPIDDHRLRLEEWSRILYIRKWFRLADRISMRLALVARFARLAVLERRETSGLGDARRRLAATLHFSRRRYGPGPDASRR